MNKKVEVEDYVLRILWENLPWGACKGAMMEGEMRSHINRWAQEKRDE